MMGFTWSMYMYPIPRMIYPSWLSIRRMGSGFEGLFITLKAKQTGNHVRGFKCAHREIDLANPKTNRRNAGFTDEEREGISNLLAEGFLDTFRHLYPDLENAYSWWSYRAGGRNAGWRIDYFVVSDDLPPRFGKHQSIPKSKARIIVPSRCLLLAHRTFLS